jgi:hypothetical protein
MGCLSALALAPLAAPKITIGPRALSQVQGRSMSATMPAPRRKRSIRRGTERESRRGYRALSKYNRTFPEPRDAVAAEPAWCRGKALANGL